METDISKIVSLIMENPDLIEQIKSLAKSENSNEEKTQTDITPEETAPAVTYEAMSHGIQKSSRRRELLSALKPYLSPERARAVDSMMSISDIIEIARRS